MTAEQTETYRKAIASLQSSHAATKAARLEVFRGMKAGLSSSASPAFEASTAE